MRNLDCGLRNLKKSVLGREGAILRLRAMNKKHQNKTTRRCGANLFRNPQSAIRTGQDRRGILLLVVLSLLVLFLLVGTSYVVSSNQYRRANKSLAKPDEPAKSPLQHTDLVEEVVNQLVRDTTNANSALRYHSLLRDLYGEDGLEIGPTSSNGLRFADLTNRGAYDFTFSNIVLSGGDHPALSGTQLDNEMLNKTGNQFFWAAVIDPNNRTLSRQDNYYNGRVFTLMDGPATGRSARVLRYHYDELGQGLFYLTFIDSDRHFTSFELDILQTHVAVLNGQPFNGTGVGYNPGVTTGARLSANEDVFDIEAGVFQSRPIALMPNAAMFFPDLVKPFSGDPNDFFLSQGEQILLTPEEKGKRVALRGMAGLGGSDESYDAADFQNMALGLSPVSPGEAANPVDQVLVYRGPDGMLGTEDDRPLVLPSFHRPALINYWRNQLITGGLGTTHFEPSLLRKVLLRPSWMDHPNFTGSNPDFNGLLQLYLANQNDPNSQRHLLDSMVYGPWDVDNDNDGRRDSVWVDFGAPVMMGPQGRLVKPLAAVLCLDMDGRLNLNAHGTSHLAGLDDPGEDLDVPLLAGNQSSGALPEGQGYGPAEISLESVLSVTNPSSTVNFSQFEELLTGGTIYEDADDSESASRRWSGRYGWFDEGVLSSKPGVYGSYDLLAQFKQQGLPQRAGRTASLQQKLGNYATPPDLFGRYAVGLNELGQPVYEVQYHLVPDYANGGMKDVDLDMDSPYELDLSRVGPNSAGDNAKDGPFSLAEMERILRAFDRDAGKLPPRLWELANRFRSADSSGFADIEELNEWRALLTTDSFDLPVPNVAMPEWMVLGANGTDDASTSASNDDFEDVMADANGKRVPTNLSVSDLFEYRIRIALAKKQGGGVLPKDVPQADVQRVMNQLLAPELADGLRMDLNRPFGNGVDEQDADPGELGHGVVDEPGEFDPATDVERPFWRVDSTRIVDQGLAADISAFTGRDGNFRDNIDRDGDGVVEAWERGDADNDGNLSPVELVNLHNFRRQLFARHLYVLAMTLVDPLPSTGNNEAQEKRARQLAQWAINVADFRDPDNIMTAFEYDAKPFDGWGVDGIIANDGPDGTPDLPPGSVDDSLSTDDDETTNPDRAVVWGLERPELVMTETLAWHDRRTTDESSPVESSNIFGDVTEKAAFVTDSEEPDLDFDQLYRPRGALFVELSNPWPAEMAANADTHRINPSTGEDLGINMAAYAVNPSNVDERSPVWRIAVYQRPAGLESLETAGWDPESPDPAEKPPFKMDRAFYFGNIDVNDSVQIQHLHAMDADDGVAFHSSLNMPVVRPGRFLVVGAGEEESSNPGVYVTEIGATIYSNVQRRIELDPNNDLSPVRFVEPTEENPNPKFTGDFFSYPDPDLPNSAICDVAIINRAISSDGSLSLKRNMTITEPAKGYPGDDLTNVSNSPLVPNNTISYYDNPNGEGWYGSQIQKQAYDTPLDNNRKDGEIRLQLPPQPEDPRIVECFSWLYLQRLANPLLPFDKDANPYLTIDSMSTNVTVFNGAQGDPTDPGELIRPNPNALPINYSNNYATQYFASLQRGFAASKIFEGSSRPSVFSHEPSSGRVQNDSNADLKKNGMHLPPTNDRPTGIEAFSQAYKHTINAIPEFTLGALNRFDRPNSGAIPGATLGLTPKEPQPWLAWNNRPFTGGNELMMVPRSRSSQLLREFSGHVNLDEPYKAATGSQDLEYLKQRAQGMFGHLPNFSLTEKTGGSTFPGNPVNMSRVLDYVGVPSRYVGTETWMNPAEFGDTDVTSTDDPRYLRQPPFNKVPSFRDPGRVNLNTVVDARVWDGGVMHRDLSTPSDPYNPVSNEYDKNTGHLGPLFDGSTGKSLVKGRRAYASSDNQMLELDPNKPTFFANPFRSSDAGDLVPIEGLIASGLDCTLLRSSKAILGASAKPDGTPLFYSKKDSAANSNFAAVDTERNPFFRYQPMTRLENLTTTRSNVYAVWVTIGFFEVEEAPDRVVFKNQNDPSGTLSLAESNAIYDRVYPEGYQLGREMGSDTGEFVRLREFAIVDRSIPVAFEPGENHNVERAIRLRRRIE